MHPGWICFLNQCFVGTENQETESGHSVVSTHRVLSRSLNAPGFFVSSFGVLSHCRSPPSPVIRKNSNFRITEENMKTPRDFDYDIWKDDSGYYYIRVKRTGETARVSKDVVRSFGAICIEWRSTGEILQWRKKTVRGAPAFFRWTIIAPSIGAYTPYPMNRGSSAGKTHMRKSSWSCWNRTF